MDGTAGGVEGAEEWIDSRGANPERPAERRGAASGGGRWGGGGWGGGEAYAKRMGIPCEVYPADWRKYGKKAGMVRNAEMAEVADELVAIWDGRSRGTAAMIRMMRRRKKSVAVYGCDGVRVE